MGENADILILSVSMTVVELLSFLTTKAKREIK